MEESDNFTFRYIDIYAEGITKANLKNYRQTDRNCAIDFLG